MNWAQLVIELVVVACVGGPTVVLPRAWRLAPVPAPPWWFWSERGWLRFVAAGPSFTVALWGLPAAYLTAVLDDPPKGVRLISLIGSFWSVTLLLFAFFVYATLRPQLCVPPLYRPVLRGAVRGLSR